MATLRSIYSVLDQGYTHGKLQYILGDDGDPSVTVNDPEDTKINDIDPYKDGDPELFSYMGGASLDTPRALLCNVFTNFSLSPPTSTGKYSVCTYTPATSEDPDYWSITGPKDIALKDPTGAADVAGNPHGVVQAGGFLYIVEHDSTNIYRVDIAAFEAATGETYQVNGVTDASQYVPVPAGKYAHGAAALILPPFAGRTYLYVLFTVDDGYGDSYSPSVLVRYIINTSTGALAYHSSLTTLGLNATALVPVPDTSPTSSISILIPAIGGYQNAGSTNGTASVLNRVEAYNSSWTVKTAFTGDSASPDPFPAGNYDIRGVAASEDGSKAYLLTGTYNEDYRTNWKLYQTTAANILGSTDQTLSDAVDSFTLVQIDSTADPAKGDPGYYWEVQYENAESAENGRLWFVKGSPIRISLGGNYGAYKLIGEGHGDPLYSPEFEVNSMDLIGEMISQAAKGISKDTRLIKGSQAAQAAKSAAAAEEEEK
jgi:hypothetical protein